MKRAGVPRIRFHDLRHTHATLALQSGIHPKVISERLGHANIGVTLDTYSHAIPALQEEAAELIASEVSGPKVLTNVEDGVHVCHNRPYKFRPQTSDWMAQQLAAT